MIDIRAFSSALQPTSDLLEECNELHLGVHIRSPVTEIQGSGDRIQPILKGLLFEIKNVTVFYIQESLNNTSLFIGKDK